jgi:serine protease
MFDYPEETLNQLAAAGTDAERKGNPLPNLNLWQTLVLNDDSDAQAIAANLKQNAIIDVIEVIDKPLPPPSAMKMASMNGRKLQTATPNFEPDQNYLNPAPDGIDAEYAWTRTGGTGEGIKIYDVEYSWNQDHEDLSLHTKLLVTGK